MAYALPGVKPNVRQCADDIGTQFNIRTIYGVGARSTRGSDHPGGLALDFMCDVATGRRLRAALIANWARYGIKYIIHEQKILESPTGQWTQMEDRGSATANHFDHVHVSFNNVAVSGTLNLSNDPVDTSGWEKGTIAPNGIVDQVANLAAFITNGENWMRLLMFVAGLAAILIALFPMLKGAINAR